MISKETKRISSLLITVGHKTWCLPYYWDEKKECVKATKRWAEVFIWNLILLTNLIWRVLAGVIIFSNILSTSITTTSMLFAVSGLSFFVISLTLSIIFLTNIVD